MKDSRGNPVTIGDRVHFLWNFDNKVHTGEILEIQENIIRVDIIDMFERRSSITEHTKLWKI